MKKVLFTLLAMSMASSVYASCDEGKAVSYFVKNGKVSKQTIKVAECANAGGGFLNWTFKNGKELGIGSQYGENFQSLNGNPVKQVVTPKGVPSDFACFALSSKGKEVYCVK